MKVILLKDVAKIGRKNAIVEVPDGYARNQLIPKKLANPATPENLKAISHLHHQQQDKEKAQEENFFNLKNSLQNQIVTIKGLKSDNGHLFAAIKPEQIVAAAKELSIDIEPSFLKLKEPLKTTGQHHVTLSHGPYNAEFVINVE